MVGCREARSEPARYSWASRLTFLESKLSLQQIYERHLTRVTLKVIVLIFIAAMLIGVGVGYAIASYFF